MKGLLKSLMLCAMLFTAASCVYDFDPQIEGTGGLLVIEGDILAGDTTIVQVSRMSALSDDATVQSVSGIRVYVESEDGTQYLADEYYSGQSNLLDDPHYRIDTRALDVNQRCRLVVRLRESLHWEGLTPVFTYRNYMSDWLEVQQTASVLDSIGFFVNPERTQLDVNVWNHGGTEQGYYRWIGREIWEYTSEFRAAVYYNPSLNKVIPYENNENYFYCWKRRAPREIMIASTLGLAEDKLSEYTVFSTTNKGDERFSILYSLTLLQERLTPEAYAYWLATMRNTSDAGGLMSPQPSDLQGNIRCEADPDEKVIGFINASTVTRTQKYYRHTVGKFFYSAGNGTVPVILKENLWAKYYEMDYRPLWIYIPPDVEEMVNQPEEYEWAPVYTCDCRLRGGYKNPPANWPYNHF